MIISDLLVLVKLINNHRILLFPHVPAQYPGAQPQPPLPTQSQPVVNPPLPDEKKRPADDKTDTTASKKQKTDEKAGAKTGELNFFFFFFK